MGMRKKGRPGSLFNPYMSMQCARDRTHAEHAWRFEDDEEHIVRWCAGARYIETFPRPKQ